VNCWSCSHQNHEGARFCTSCGAPLYAFCPTCHAAIEDGDRFCGGCGYRLERGGAGSSVATLPPPPTHPHGHAISSETPKPTGSQPQMAPERKTVTVLFADISGFTAMSEKLDPEDVSTIMNDCLGMMAECVTHYEGYVDKFIGDCIMAIFGAPVTHENDPELAVRAALDMLKGIDDQNLKVPVKLEKPLALHIGINTGVAIAGGVGYDQKMDYTVMGDMRWSHIVGQFSGLSKVYSVV
jgi:hypothetical protein